MLRVRLCRYKGFYEYAKTKGLEVGPPVGLDVLIDGTVATSILSALLPHQLHGSNHSFR